MRKYIDVVSGSAFLLLGIALYVYTYSIRSFSDASSGVTFLPRLVSVLMIGVSVIVIHNGHDRLRRDPEEGGLPKMHGFFMSLGLVFVYILALERLGFILDTFLYIVVQVGILSGFDRKKMLLGAAIGAVFTVAVYLIFSRLVYIMLPAGILG
jgi:hypothetical protein